jgi:hypothetical protein
MIRKLPVLAPALAVIGCDVLRNHPQEGCRDRLGSTDARRGMDGTGLRRLMSRQHTGSAMTLDPSRHSIGKPTGVAWLDAFGEALPVVLASPPPT